MQTVPLTGAVVVSTPSDVSLEDARKALEMFAQVNVEVLGIVENMSHFTCPHCHHEIDIFSRGGAERTAQAVQRAVSGIDRTDSGDPRGRRPGIAGGAGRPEEPAGSGVLCHRGESDGARRRSSRAATSDVIEIS